MNWEPGQWLTAVTVVSGAVGTLWTLAGKSRDTNYTRLESDRNRLDVRVAELERGRQEDRTRLDRVEAELEALRLDHKTLLDFLRDVVGGQFDLAWVTRRAQELLTRMGGSGGGTP